MNQKAQVCSHQSFFPETEEPCPAAPALGPQGLKSKETVLLWTCLTFSRTEATGSGGPCGHGFGTVGMDSVQCHWHTAHVSECGDGAAALR